MNLLVLSWCGCLVLGGCATIERPPPANVHAAKNPPVSIIFNDGDIWVTHTDDEGTETTSIRRIARTLEEELQRLALFKHGYLVVSKDGFTQDEVVFDIHHHDRVSDPNPAKMLISLGSALMIPTVWTHETSVTVKIKVRSEVVCSYDYRFSSKESYWLLRVYENEFERRVMQSFWKQFVADIEKDKVFEELVPAALKRQAAETAGKQNAAVPP